MSEISNTEQANSHGAYVRRLVAEVNALRAAGDDMARVFRSTLDEFGWSDDESAREREVLDGWKEAREADYPHQGLRS